MINLRRKQTDEIRKKINEDISAITDDLFRDFDALKPSDEETVI